MARTWYAGSADAPMNPPSRAAVPNISYDSAPSNQSVSSKNQISVHDSDLAHAVTPTTKVTHFDSVSDGSVTWTKPSTSPQNEPIAQIAKENIRTPPVSTKLTEHYLKPMEPQTAAIDKSRDPRLFRTDALALSPSVPRQAPIAQMVPLPSNTAVTTTPGAAITIPSASTTSPFSAGPSTLDASLSLPLPSLPIVSSQLTATAVPKEPSLPILPSQPTATPRKDARQTSTPKRTPKITITPAPATAPSAFKDAAPASNVQNAMLLTPPTKQQTNGIQKRKYTKKNRPPLDSSPTADSVPKEKRGRGRPRKPQIEVQSPRPKTQHRPAKTQRQQNPTPKSNPPTKPPLLCSEEPHRWPNSNDYVASLGRRNATPKIMHTEPARACANQAAHLDGNMQQPSRAHGVCNACRHNAYRHIRATRPELLGSAWWPLCETCGEREKQRVGPNTRGCSCNSWLCFSCLIEVAERRELRNSVEAEVRRRTLIGETIMDGEDETAFTGWACECGEEILWPDATFMKCVGCDGIRFGRLDPRETFIQEELMRKTALGCT